VLSTIAQVVSIWFPVATAAALGLGTTFRAVATIPAPVPITKRARLSDVKSRQDVCA
jgi:hypothetical protein